MFYIFIFDKKYITEAQIRNIQISQSNDRKHLSPLGFNIDDYRKIESAVIDKNKGQKQKIKMILVADPYNCKMILDMKRHNKTLNDL